jgi:predicted dehydrogenase
MSYGQGERQGILTPKARSKSKVSNFIVKILIVGYSSVVKRRMLQALLLLPKVERVDIASRHGVQADDLPANWDGDLYTDYTLALERSQADLVYISLINSLHEEWVTAALRSGKLVVVDKPALVSLAATERLLDVADHAGLCLAEAVVFADHSQFDTIRGLIEESGGINRLMAVLSFPPLPTSNFRNYPELGGGALLDLGPYAAASSRLFFKDAPEEVLCRILSTNPRTNVETAFMIAARYPAGGGFLGHFGFDTEYQNCMTALGPQISLSVNRVFTTPFDLESKIFVSRRNGQSTVTCPAVDMFGLFFTRVIRAIEARAWEPFIWAMHQDAKFRERMRWSAGEGGR